MSEMKTRTCPNCGADVVGTVCGYCGSRDADFPTLSIGEEATFSFERDGRRYSFKLIVEHFSLDFDNCSTDLYSDNGRYMTLSNPEGRISLEGRMVPFNHEVLGRKRIFFMRENV